MKKNKKAETFVWVIVAIVIFIILITLVFTVFDIKNKSDSIIIKNLEKKIFEENIKTILEKTEIPGKIRIWEKFFLNSDWENFLITKNKIFEDKDFYFKNNKKFKLHFIKNEQIENINTLPEIKISF